MRGYDQAKRGRHSQVCSICLIHSQKKLLSVSFLPKIILELKCCLGSGIFTAAVKRGVAPHTRKQRVLVAISKLRSAFFTGYKNKICTYYIIIGEREKRARHSQVCSIENRGYIAYYTSKSGIWLVISQVASYFHEPKASANTAYE